MGPVLWWGHVVWYVRVMLLHSCFGAVHVPVALVGLFLWPGCQGRLSEGYLLKPKVN